MSLNIFAIEWQKKFVKAVILAHCTTMSYMLQEDAGVNHIAAKIIDSISAKPGPHAAVCIDF